MEVEIKIRLFSETDMAKLELALASPLIRTEDQDNVFFEGVNKELCKLAGTGGIKVIDSLSLCLDNTLLSINQQLVFRIRIIQTTGSEPKAVVALKGNAVLVDGIAHVEEEEQLIDVNIAYQIIENPNLIPEAAQNHRLLKKIVDRVPCPEGYIHMGRFRNLRHKYQWNEYEVELDRTMVQSDKSHSTSKDT
ncbi:hypothetical protein BGZ74_006910 [Mortierella antarctica]|nr:hypothetical protein BGZ74_006910 [Mortierella antarctica]